MRILVTGVSGQIGSAICDQLAESGSLIKADRSILDLSKPPDIAPRLESLKPNLIVNAAAYTAVDRAETESELAFLVNCAGPQAIAEWAAPRAIPLIHFSSDYVFSGAGQHAWREDDPPAPLNVYGKSKVAGEEAVRRAGGPHLILRTSWIYSAGPAANFFNTMIRLASHHAELRVVDDQIGSPTPARAIATTLSQIIVGSQNNQDILASAFAAAGGTVHLCAGGETSRFGFAEAIVDGLRRRNMPVSARRVISISTADEPRKAPRPLNSRLDLGRLASVFGIRPERWDALLEAELNRHANLASRRAAL